MTLLTRFDTQSQTVESVIEMPDLNEFMTTDEAAKALDFTVGSVRQLVYKKKLEFLEIFEP